MAITYSSNFGGPNSRKCPSWLEKLIYKLGSNLDSENKVHLDPNLLGINFDTNPPLEYNILRVYLHKMVEALVRVSNHSISLYCVRIARGR